MFFGPYHFKILEEIEKALMQKIVLQLFVAKKRKGKRSYVKRINNLLAFNMDILYSFVFYL